MNEEFPTPDYRKGQEENHGTGDKVWREDQLYVI